MTFTVQYTYYGKFLYRIQWISYPASLTDDWVHNLNEILQDRHRLATHSSWDRMLSTTATVGAHLDWTKKQGRILTCGGRAEEYYSAERGFPFDETELPHHHLGMQQKTTHIVFESWRKEDEKKPQSPLVGAWKRVLFYGGWEHTTDRDEHTFNLQSRTLFIDLRIPCSRSILFDQQQHRIIHSLEDLLPEQLRWYARQHIFAGYTRLSSNNDDPTRLDTTKFDTCCTRHHCIDWNFVGKGRTRPNKWWVDLMPEQQRNQPHGTDNETAVANVWKEWAYATDQHGHHYYCEQWERWESYTAQAPVVVLRRRCTIDNVDLDGVLIVVGDHFNFCSDRRVKTQSAPYHDCASLVDLVDAAVERNDLETARAWLGLQGGHGRVSKGWQLDKCIEFWREGNSLWNRNDVRVQGDTLAEAMVIWNEEKWDIFECSLASVVELRELLHCGVS